MSSARYGPLMSARSGHPGVIGAPGSGQAEDLRALLRAQRARSLALSAQMQVLYRRAQAAWQHAQATWDQVQASSARRPMPVTRRDLLEHSAYARLVAKVESLPVIEQAKGIIMAESGCTADKAFDALRRASQRLNLPVRDLAASIVDTRSHSAPLPPRPLVHSCPSMDHPDGVGIQG